MCYHVSGRRKLRELDRETSREKPSDILTSSFLRFNENDRSQRLTNINYESTNGLTLGQRIGSGEDYSLPKIGLPIVRSILLKLKAKSKNVLGDVYSKGSENKSKYVIWRRRGAEYWINPFKENLFGKGKSPADFDPMYFQDEPILDTAFILMQSSLFYMCWMVYGDQRHVNWTFISSFPMPELNQIKQMSKRIHILANNLWIGMKERFDLSAGTSGEIRGMTELKPLVNEIDELLGQLYGLSDDEIGFVKNYETEYGR